MEIEAIQINGREKKLKIENNLYQELITYVKDHYGFGSDLLKTDLYKRYLKAKENLRQFNNKKIKLSYSYTADFLGGSGIKYGKLVFFKNDKGEEEIRFYEGLNRSKFHYLDFGLFDGFFAVLIIKEIEEASKEDFKQYLKEQKEIKEKRKWGF